MRVTTFCYNSFDEKTKIMKGAVTLMSIITLLDALVEELNLAEEKFFNVPKDFYALETSVKSSKETTPDGVALKLVLRTDLIFHLLDYSLSVTREASRMLRTKGYVLDSSLMADTITTSKRRITC